MDEWTWVFCLSSHRSTQHQPHRESRLSTRGTSFYLLLLLTIVQKAGNLFYSLFKLFSFTFLANMGLIRRHTDCLFICFKTLLRNLAIYHIHFLSSFFISLFCPLGLNVVSSLTSLSTIVMCFYLHFLHCFFIF